MSTRLPTTGFAILDGPPRFQNLLEGNQTYLPSRERYEYAFRDIFNRQYYTNQGPLTSRLEERLAAFHGVRNVVCVTNATIGLIMAAEAMELRGRIIVPALASVSVLQSLEWAGIEPLFCDVDPVSHQIDTNQTSYLLNQGHGEIAAILAVNQWGSICDVVALRNLAGQFGTRLYFDSVHAFADIAAGSPICGLADVQVLSVHSGRIMGGAEGGFLCTNDDALAARLRNIRSSYGAGTPVTVAKTSNGRMSEAQAALGLMHLEDFQERQFSNHRLFNCYARGLETLSGLRLLKPSGANSSNYAYLICEIDESTFGMSRDCLVAVLKAENVSARHHACFETALQNPASKEYFPQAAKIIRNYFQLPLGVDISENDVGHVCSLIAAAKANAAMLANAVA
jgi:dTDP-4-amino-4,6-dideoxygalactose transaminase